MVGSETAKQQGEHWREKAGHAAMGFLSVPYFPTSDETTQFLLRARVLNKESGENTHLFLVAMGNLKADAPANENEKANSSPCGLGSPL